MKQLVIVVAVLIALPVPTALADDLSDLLERGGDASYSAEQIIACSTPDGPRDAVVRIDQGPGGLHVATPSGSEVEVTSGSGGWILTRRGTPVSGVVVEATGHLQESRYDIDDAQAAAFLGRKAGLYRLWDGDLLRAELIIDGQTGVVLRAITYGDDGDVYCERRLIAFDPSPSTLAVTAPEAVERIEPVADHSGFPDQLAGFTRLDSYVDEDGFSFAYYSDGFFSFALFETPAVVTLDEPVGVAIGDGSYGRTFTPGQVTYVWETKEGGMALVGDLPPDLHSGVLESLPTPERQGWLSRLWRSLFG